MQLLRKISPFYNLMLFYIIVSIVLRIVLLFHPITQSSFDFIDIVKIFGFGLISDFFIFVLVSGFLWLYLIFISNSKYLKPYGYLFFGLLVTLLLYVSFGNTILNEYGGALPAIGIIFIAIKTILFGLLLFLPKYRSQIRFWLFTFVIFLYVVLILQNGISEYFFWNEFGVKYNFIAVNYLVYTNEVIGNIMQSYPVIPIFTVLFIVAGLITYLIIRRSKNYIDSIPTFVQKVQLSGIYFALFGLSLVAIPFLSAQENSPNIFTNELEANGIYKFFLAFKNSELDYFKFYKTLPEKEAYTLLQEQIPGISGETSLRQIQSDATENHKNVVLITIESYSADFMKMYGNEQNLTPFLDSLATKSLLFTNLYAVGNRTVRGLEAVTLCFPPTAGESVVKREDNKNKFSTGNIFKQKGYTVKYLYGGDAFFDNMEDFFTGNGYGIVDKKAFTPEEITFSNVWGVCDEDMYSKAIKVMDDEAKENKPFFNHIMTVSNHRPFTYPNNKIDIPGDAKSRDGGVKYTDFAMKKFFEMASKQPWFANTVFVILADHCASSAGKMELPVDKYRIPAMIYSPGYVQPQHFTNLMSQIDIMPTLFGLLNFNYQSKFYGQDVLKTDYKPRALIATYQDLGLIKDNVLTIISPKQQVKQFQLTLKSNQKIAPNFQIYYNQNPLIKERTDLVNQTISYYQTASDMLKKKKYQKIN
ncbi:MULTISPECIES: LTA synthase family protein [Flavobacterium]|uniref:Sulfatase-like hydrolase/transferase n=1 Tax=Flavobacterium gawalongense TaxID=2594432 RepID=A0A553BGJ5_9FLAO|nr:alkaline phosphatase family protein [Flavobacterium gawalongense]TRW99999.1 sulfatase-like hydrolase/transferase [Flavobacterium gawalongense]TRX04770.1 sulfatase-like hydrolase/transferase [Flavobacterium gawalongense]TRX07356.1 sulfatase-like hydrolase/transferase [Flavobacterium gawalongense]TRX08373.1 sulfatase-like hydrolase/transferase [Flavobacterium gawalongense]TRX24438.1 sulfatase-like hydrolase/transferase [Flavobacterium gawalongense]